MARKVVMGDWFSQGERRGTGRRSSRAWVGVALVGGVAACSGRLANESALAADSGEPSDSQGDADTREPSCSPWSEGAELAPDDAIPGDEFGLAVSISGGTALVGAAQGAIGGQGAAYTFVESGGAWTQQQKLVPSDGAPGDCFGQAVALEGNTAIIVAFCDGGPGSAAYVFAESGGNWNQQQKLVASDGVKLGPAVSISGDTAVVGGYMSAYVFTSSAGMWTERQKLVAQDFTDVDNTFGVSVSISGGTIVVGASGTGPDNKGAVYVFVPSGDQWMLQQKLMASDGVSEDFFGWSVALAGDTVLVGALSAGRSADGLTAPGAAYVFVRSRSAWQESQKLVASDSKEQGFGASVSLVGSTAIVGRAGIFGNEQATADRGAAFVFVQSGNVWQEQQKLVASDGAVGDDFAQSVALAPSKAIVGAPGKASKKGAVYVEEIRPATHCR